VACLVLLHTYGLQGAVGYTLPILGSRVQVTFFAAYVFLVNYFHFLVTRAFNRFKRTAVGKVALELKDPALNFALAVHLIFCMLFGQEYLLSTMDYCNNLLLHLLNRVSGEVMTRVYTPWRARVQSMQKSSAFFAFICRRAFEFGVFTILGISILFAFLSVCALDESSLVVSISEERGHALIDDVQGDDTRSGADIAAKNADDDDGRIMGTHVVDNPDDKLGDEVVHENPKLDDDVEELKEVWEWEEAESEHRGATKGKKVVYEKGNLCIDMEEPT